MKHSTMHDHSARTCSLSCLRQRVGVRADSDGIADDACKAASLTLALSPQGEREQEKARSH